ncbi:MAG TPA: pirin family protein, partial [Flavisolibacter sp.]|nr:pirin family protein [Flavisolibacter sp.]
MNYRNITTQTYAHEFQMGPMRVKQPLPVKGLEQVSPFILLHHAGPQHHNAGAPRTRLNPHPHRGFEPVTFLFNGKLHHKDSLGNTGFLKSGDVQWMTSGSGIIHSEGPSDEFAKEGGDMELIQLWVNLPREFKMTAPKYQDIKKENIPVVKDDNEDFELNLVAGEYKGLKGPASTFSPIIAMTGKFKTGAATEIEIPENYNALVYVLSGKIESNGAVVDALHMGVFDHNSNFIQLSAKEDSQVL